MANIIGTDNSEILNGTSGNDTIKGGGGADQINAGSGNDYILGGAGADAIDGGSGIDTASYENSNAAVAVNLGPPYRRQAAPLRVIRCSASKTSPDRVSTILTGTWRQRDRGRRRQ